MDFVHPPGINASARQTFMNNENDTGGIVSDELLMHSRLPLDPSAGIFNTVDEDRLTPQTLKSCLKFRLHRLWNSSKPSPCLNSEHHLLLFPVSLHALQRGRRGWFHFVSLGVVFISCIIGHVHFNSRSNLRPCNSVTFESNISRSCAIKVNVCALSCRRYAAETRDNDTVLHSTRLDGKRVRSMIRIITGNTRFRSAGSPWR